MRLLPSCISQRGYQVGKCMGLMRLQTQFLISYLMLDNIGVRPILLVDKLLHKLLLLISSECINRREIRGSCNPAAISTGSFFISLR